MNTKKGGEFIFFLLPFLIFSHKLFQGVFFFEDVSFLHIPLRWFVHNALLHHRSFLFIWNFGFGLPLISEGQFGTFYPLKYLFIFFNDIHLGYTLEMLTTYFITYSGMYLFAKEIGLKRGAYISAIFFTFAGPLTGRHPFMNMVEVFSLMPWVFFTTRRFLKTGKIKFAILTTLLISLQIFAYHPQAVYMSSLSLFIYILLEKESNLRLQSKLLFFMAIHVIAILISLPQILPIIELLKGNGTTTLAKYRGGYHWMQKGGLNFLIHFPYFFFPRFQGFHMIIRHSLSLESITLTLSGILIASVGWKGGKLRVFKILAIISFSLMFVKYNPAYFLLSKLPIIKNFRYNVRWVIPLSFSLSILGGKGVEFLLKRPVMSQKVDKIFYFIISFIAFNYILARLILGVEFQKTDILKFSEWSNIFLISIYTFLFVLFILKRYKTIGVILPCMFLFEIYIASSRLLVTIDKKDLKQQILYKSNTITNTRYFREGISFHTTIYDSIKKYYYMPQTDTVKLINTYYRYYVGNMFIEDNDEVNIPFTAPQLLPDFLLSSCYILKDTFNENVQDQFFKIMGINAIITSKPIKINNFKLKDSIFPFFIYTSVKHYKKYRFYSLKEEKNNFTFKEFEKMPFKWDTILPIEPNTPDIPSCTDIARVLKMYFMSDTLYLKIKSPCKKYLLIAYRYHKGIKAYLNGQKVPIYRGFGQFITVIIPEGISTLKIFYHYPFKWTIYFSIFLIITLLFCLLC